MKYTDTWIQSRSIPWDEGAYLQMIKWQTNIEVGDGLSMQSNFSVNRFFCQIWQFDPI